jgi:outer membrane receptor protein involved in Fe transport
MDMKDELDFDVATLRYVNIGRSRHRGVEFGGRYETQPGVMIFLHRTIQQAKARSGDDAGKYLKAIPRRITSGGFTALPFSWLELSTVYTEYRQIYLDDANARRIPDYTRFDWSMGIRLPRDVRLTLEGRNTMRVPYSTTGFPDPAGGSEAFFYPAASYSLLMGVRYGW